MQTKKAFNKHALWRGAIPIAVSVILLWSFAGGLLSLDTTTILQTVQQFPLHRWALAAALTVLSFAAVAQYDRIVTGWLELDLPRKSALHAGWRATAISQVLGYGLVTGALTRWRALGSQDVSLWDCSRITALASVAFFVGWTVVTALALLLGGKPALPSLPTGALLAVLGAAIALGALCLHPPRRLARWVPGLNSYLAAIFFTAIDTIAAAAVIFIFLPDGYIAFLPFYALFLVAFSAGMLSGLPAGLGAFEVTMVALLAPTDQAPLLSAVLAYRLIYYAAPAIVAAVTLIGTRDSTEKTAPVDPSSMVPHDLALFAPPEADLTTQGLLKITCPRGASKSGALWHRARHTDILLGDPFGPEDGNLAPFQINAHQAKRSLCLYKIGADWAKRAERLGFMTFCIGSEAILQPHSFTTKGSSRRQLRRKLKQAERAGVTVTDVPPPYAELEALDRAWQDRNGRPRGFSMGFLSPQLLNRQRIFTAERDGKPIAFLTLLIGADRWSLDLMRAGEDAPDGTMHALLTAAIVEAKAEQVPELSLAAAPLQLTKAPSNLAERLVHAGFTRNRQLQGLAQFKACFDPIWEPRFLAIDSALALPLALHDLWFLINRPEPPAPESSKPHNHYALYEFDSPVTPCHALGRMTEQDPLDDAA